MRLFTVVIGLKLLCLYDKIDELKILYKKLREISK